MGNIVVLSTILLMVVISQAAVLSLMCKLNDERDRREMQTNLDKF